jgi:hypothetical protein
MASYAVLWCWLVKQNHPSPDGFIAFVAIAARHPRVRSGKLEAGRTVIEPAWLPPSCVVTCGASGLGAARGELAGMDIFVTSGAGGGRILKPDLVFP